MKEKRTRLERKLLETIAKATTLEERRKALRHLAMIYRQREYYRTHKEAVVARRNAWIAKNPERWRALARKNIS